MGTAIGGANMWALLLDKDPGHSAAAGDLAADVIDRNLKKAASVAVKAEEAPPADNIAKPAKRVNKAKMSTKSAAAGCSKQAAAIVDDTVQKQMNGDGDTTLPYVVAEADVSKEEEEFIDVVARRRTVAGRARKATTTVVDVIDRKLKKPVVLEVAEPASKMANKEKKGAAGAGDSKQAAALAATMESSGDVPTNVARDSKQTEAPATVLGGEEMTSNGRDEIEVTLAALPTEDWAAEEEEAKEEEMFNVVASRGGRRRTVAARKSKVVADGVTVVAGTNMWSLLNDNDPGHGGAEQATKGKKTKTKKKKKDAAEDSKQADSVDDDKEKETSAAADLELSTTLRMTGEAATGGSRCRTVARVCMAVLPVAMLDLYFHAAV